MQKFYNKKDELINIVDSVKYAKNTEDFFYIICKISKIYDELGDDGLREFIIVERNNIHINLFNNVFSNEIFSDKLLRILILDKEIHEDINIDFKDKEAEVEKKILEELTLVHIALDLSVFLFAITLPFLTQETISFIYRIISTAIKTILRKQNGQFSISNVCFRLYKIAYNRSYHYDGKSKIFINLDNLFSFLEISRSLIGGMMLIIPQSSSLKLAIKLSIQKKDKIDGFFLPKELLKIHGLVKKIYSGIKHFQEYYKKKMGETDNHFDRFINFFTPINDKNTLYIFRLMTEGFHSFVIYREENFSTAILDKISRSNDIRQQINKFVKSNLSAYSGQVSDENFEWSNKIFLISNKVLSTLEAITDAKDENWKINVFVYEYSHWLDDVHQVLNKHDLEDDWTKIAPLLYQEDTRVEWKSSFLTPTQEKFSDEAVEKKRKRDILSSITRAMLGMMNSEGGTILVGLVENPGLIVRDEIKKNMIQRGGLYFFNIKYELSKENKTLDQIKREIQDILVRETKLSVEKFNDLWSIEPISIRSDDSIIEIYKLQILKSQKPIYVMRENGGIWLSLIKRADGQTVHVDPRDNLYELYK